MRKKNLWRSKTAVWCLVVCMEWMPASALADRKDQLQAPPEAGNSSLQEVIRKRRSDGPVFVSIPAAYTFGLDRTNDYCSPSVRSINSSHLSVEELIVGIAYRRQADGKPVGTTVTRMALIDSGEQDTHYFYRLDTRECGGLTGEVTVVRCVYANGQDCASNVQAIGFGAVPLQLKTP